MEVGNKTSNEPGILMSSGQFSVFTCPASQQHWSIRTTAFLKHSFLGPSGTA